MRRVYRNVFITHVLTGFAFTLLFSFGVTYMLAASNGFILVMAIALPIVDSIATMKYVRNCREAYPELQTNRIVSFSIAGFGIGMFIFLCLIYLLLG